MLRGGRGCSVTRWAGPWTDEVGQALPRALSRDVIAVVAAPGMRPTPPPPTLRPLPAGLHAKYGLLSGNKKQLHIHNYTCIHVYMQLHQQQGRLGEACERVQGTGHCALSLLLVARCVLSFQSLAKTQPLPSSANLQHRRSNPSGGGRDMSPNSSRDMLHKETWEED